MSDVSAHRPPLGVGLIIGDAFSIFFRRFGLMFVLALVPAIIALGLILALQPILFQQRAANPASAIFAGVAVYIVQIFAYSLSTSLIVLAAFDTKINRPGRLSVYVRWALANILTVVILTIAISLILILILAVPIGIVTFISASVGGGGALAVALGSVVAIAAFYVFAMFSPFVPAIVVEGAGFRALGRAAQLTAGYRWPVVGFNLVLFIVLLIIGLVLGLIAALLSQIAGAWLGAVAEVAINAIGGGLFAVAIAMIYARLREVKEGMAVGALADVFD